MSNDSFVRSEQRRLEDKPVVIIQGPFAGETGEASLICRDPKGKNVVCLVYDYETDSNFTANTADCAVVEGAK